MRLCKEACKCLRGSSPRKGVWSKDVSWKCTGKLIQTYNKNKYVNESHCDCGIVSFRLIGHT